VFLFPVQVLENVLDVNTASDEFSALLHHGPQAPLAAVIDEGDFVQIDDASAPID
jgi:hypothetical protein